MIVSDGWILSVPARIERIRSPDRITVFLQFSGVFSPEMTTPTGSCRKSTESLSWKTQIIIIYICRNIFYFFINFMTSFFFLIYISLLFFYHSQYFRSFFFPVIWVICRKNQLCIKKLKHAEKSVAYKKRHTNLQILNKLKNIFQ